MQSKASTVKDFLAQLPVDRRDALEAVRKVILKNLDKDFEEGMQYGMIGYYIPHSVFPAGYHCDPRQPLPYAGLASQKGHLSLYLMCVYMNSELHEPFVAAWKKTGKKLDMGKACIRFKKADDLALDVIGATFKRVTAKKYIAVYEKNLESMGRKPKPASGSKAQPASGHAAAKKNAQASKQTVAPSKGAAKKARK